MWVMAKDLFDIESASDLLEFIGNCVGLVILKKVVSLHGG